MQAHEEIVIMARVEWRGWHIDYLEENWLCYDGTSILISPHFVFQAMLSGGIGASGCQKMKRMGMNDTHLLNMNSHNTWIEQSTKESEHNLSELLSLRPGAWITMKNQC